MTTASLEPQRRQRQHQQPHTQCQAIADSFSNRGTKYSGFIYVPYDKDFVTDSSNHVTDSGTNDHYRVFDPGFQVVTSFDDMARGTSTASMRDDDDSTVLAVTAAVVSLCTRLTASAPTVSFMILGGDPFDDRIDPEHSASLLGAPMPGAPVTAVSCTIPAAPASAQQHP
jgi:hypothetical protein